MADHRLLASLRLTRIPHLVMRVREIRKSRQRIKRSRAFCSPRQPIAHSRRRRHDPLPRTGPMSRMSLASGSTPPRALTATSAASPAPRIPCDRTRSLRLRNSSTRLMSAKALDRVWRESDGRGSAGDDVRDHLAGDRAKGQPEMAVAECEIGPLAPRRSADDR